MVSPAAGVVRCWYIVVDALDGARAPIRQRSRVGFPGESPALYLTLAGGLAGKTRRGTGFPVKSALREGGPGLYVIEHAAVIMSPAVFRAEGFVFSFYANEEERMHVHAVRPDAEAKFWIEPGVELAWNRRLSPYQLRRAKHLIKKHTDEIKKAWIRFHRQD